MDRKQELCLECMECCKHLEFSTFIPAHIDPKPIADFYEMRGCKVKMLTDRIIGVLIPAWCPHLTPKGCNIYEQRPKICRIYDGRKDPMLRDVCKWKELKDD